jgi:hypothetical protein
MKMRRGRVPVTLAAMAVTVAGAATVLAPTASAATGGGCDRGSSGPAGTVYSCISAPGYAQVRGDAYVYMNSVPSGCTVRVQVWDWEFNYVVSSTQAPCSKSLHVVAPTYSGAYDWYYTEVTVANSSPVWSPRENLP